MSAAQSGEGRRKLTTTKVEEFPKASVPRLQANSARSLGGNFGVTFFAKGNKKSISKTHLFDELDY